MGLSSWAAPHDPICVRLLYAAPREFHKYGSTSYPLDLTAHVANIGSGTSRIVTVEYREGVGSSVSAWQTNTMQLDEEFSDHSRYYTTIWPSPHTHSYTFRLRYETDAGTWVDTDHGHLYTCGISGGALSHQGCVGDNIGLLDFERYYTIIPTPTNSVWPYTAWPFVGLRGEILVDTGSNSLVTVDVNMLGETLTTTATYARSFNATFTVYGNYLCSSNMCVYAFDIPWFTAPHLSWQFWAPMETSISSISTGSGTNTDDNFTMKYKLLLEQSVIR